MNKKRDTGEGTEIGSQLSPSLSPMADLDRKKEWGPAEEIHELRKNLDTLQRQNVGLKEELQATKEALGIAQEQCVTDSLTSLANRCGIDLSFSATINALKRSMRDIGEHRKAPNVVALMIDVDRFKSVNDLYGHPIGDKMLIIVSNLMREYFGHREGEILGRWGGEEFLIILPQSDIQYAHSQASIFRSAVERTIVHLTSREKLSVTVSIGIAETEVSDLHRTSESIFTDLINRADVLLYAAKDQGRNCIRTEKDA